MKVELKIKKEYDLQLMQVCAEVRYWDDAIVNGRKCSENGGGKELPFVEGDCWRPLIELEKGKIRNWPEGTTADLHFKICDMCAWSVMDGELNTVYYQDWNYVPKILCPEENGYGDYIIMKIDENGIIQKWNTDLVFDLFEGEE